MNNDTSFIYSLVDPRTAQARYIGQTSSPQRRIKEHVDTCFYIETRVALWLRELGLAGYDPVMNIIEECPAEMARVREKLWIIVYDQCVSLTNFQWVDEQ